MQGSHASANSQSSSYFASSLHHSHTLFTPKRVGYTLAGAFVFAGATVALTSSAASHTNSPKPQGFTLQTSADTPASSSNPTDTPAASAADTTGTSNSSNHVQVTVNGKNIAVPDNGSVQETVPTTDGNGQSSVSVNTSTQGGASNTNSSSVNVNVNSSNSSSGSGFSSSSTFVSQNGGVTFISNH